MKIFINSMVLIFASLIVINCSSKSSKSISQHQKADEVSEMKRLLAKKYGLSTLKSKVTDQVVEVENVNVEINKATITAAFPASMTTYGFQFEIMQGVSDEFIVDVAKSYQSMFPQDEKYDLKKQHQVLNAMLQYRALVTVLLGHHDSMSDETLEGMSVFENGDYSLCDVIMYGCRGQAMEVVEHLLHHITDVGLFYAYPKEWSFTDKKSKVYLSMQEAIQKGFYKVESYQDEKFIEQIYERILVQEYAYWIITSYWNLQEGYGPHEEEWTLLTKDALREKLPSAFNLVDSTVGRIMKGPSKDSMDKFKKYQQ